jgi:hypothetical protein
MKRWLLLFILFFSGASFGFSPAKLSFQELIQRSDIIVIGRVLRADLIDPQGKFVMPLSSEFEVNNYGWDDEVRFHIVIEKWLKGSRSDAFSDTVTAGLGGRHVAPSWVTDYFQGKKGIFFLRRNTSEVKNKVIQFQHTSLRKLAHSLEKKDDVLMHLFCSEYGC